MGIFNKSKGNREINLSPKAALALSAMTIIAADGSINEEEISGIKIIVRGDEEAFNQAHKVFKTKPVSECIEIVTNSLNEKQKVCVIANLVDLAMADGVLVGAEEELLNTYISNFKIPDYTIQNIKDVIAAKNNFSVF